MVSLQRSMMIYSCHQLFDAPLKKRGREDYFSPLDLLHEDGAAAELFVCFDAVSAAAREDVILINVLVVLTVEEAARISFFVYGTMKMKCMFNRHNHKFLRRTMM